MGVIYKISNNINNKVYIGETIQDNPYKRWRGHQASINSGKGCPLLRKAVLKHGINNFKFEVLIICFDHDVYKYEKEYIKKYNSVVPNGYNSNEGGDPTINRTGIPHTKETIERIKNTLRQKYIDNPNLRQEIGNKVKVGMQNINLSEIIKEKQQYKRENNIPLFKNRVNSSLYEETKDKIRDSVNKYYDTVDKETKQNRKEKHSIIMSKVNGKIVSQYDLNNNLIKTYHTIIQASRETKVGKCSISNCINGKTQKGGGFIWKFVKNNSD